MRVLFSFSIAIITLSLPISQASAAPTCEAGYHYYTQSDFNLAVDPYIKLYFSGHWKPNLPCCKLISTGWGTSQVGVCVKLPPQANSGGAKSVCPLGSAKSCGAQHNVTDPTAGSPRT